MKIFISKKEIERLNKEPKRILGTYMKGDKRLMLAELIYIKVYNLLKCDFNAANKYIDKLLPLSSFCKDFDLTDYDMRDIRILIIFENNTLFGLFSELNNDSTYSLNTIVKISNNLILPIYKNYAPKIERPNITTKLLVSSNIECFMEMSYNLKNEINRRFNSEFKNKLVDNIFIESKLRKEKFHKIPDKEKDKLSNVYLHDEGSVGDYIYSICKEEALDYINSFMKPLLKEFKINLSSDILNTDYIYNQVSSIVDEVIRHRLNLRMQTNSLVKSPFLVIDLMFIKDKIDIPNNEQSKRARLLRKINQFNNILTGIYNEISKESNSKRACNVLVTYNNIDIKCNDWNIENQLIDINGYKYITSCLQFSTMDNQEFPLDNPLCIDNVVTLSISHKNKVLYSIPEEIKNELKTVQRELFEIINPTDISTNWTYTAN